MGAGTQVTRRADEVAAEINNLLLGLSLRVDVLRRRHADAASEAQEMSLLIRRCARAGGYIAPVVGEGRRRRSGGIEAVMERVWDTAFTILSVLILVITLSSGVIPASAEIQTSVN